MNFQIFLHGATIVLSALLGTLLALPLLGSGLPAPLIAVGAVLGALIGWRRKESRFFFYFVLLGVLAMASLLSFEMSAPS
ncbi:MAG: hypothetical protein KDD62_04650 [Bdellovibrionales bacterium]|nr:hypothetical protein [Bdellovibrionales bacterium]